MTVQLLTFLYALFPGLAAFVLGSGPAMLISAVVGVLVKLRRQSQVRTDRFSTWYRTKLFFILPAMLAGLSTHFAALVPGPLSASGFFFSLELFVFLPYGLIVGYTVMADALLKEQWKAIVTFLVAGYVLPLLIAIALLWLALSYPVPGVELPHPD